MAADVGVLIIHGMGSQKPDFAEPMQHEVTKQAETLGVPADRIAFQSVFWAPVLKPRQDDYLNRARTENILDFVTLREFVIGAIGDAAAYRLLDPNRDGYDPAQDTYRQIHQEVRLAIETLHGKVGSEDKALVVLAHSLGGHIMSNYYWDLEERSDAGPQPQSEFERMRTLKAFITFGCPIPMFTFAMKNPKPINLPAGALWENFYDPDDVLAYPLQSINTAFSEAVTDFPISVGNALTSWNPLSHNEYWTDPDQTVPIAQHIQNILETLDGQNPG